MSELGDEYGTKIEAANLDATTEENARICQQLGFGNHGIVIRDPSGKTLWSQKDHEVVVEDVRKKLDELLGS